MCHFLQNLLFILEKPKIGSSELKEDNVKSETIYIMGKKPPPLTFFRGR